MFLVDAELATARMNGIIRRRVWCHFPVIFLGLFWPMYAYPLLSPCVTISKKNSPDSSTALLSHSYQNTLSFISKIRSLRCHTSYKEERILNFPIATTRYTSIMHWILEEPIFECCSAVVIHTASTRLCDGAQFEYDCNLYNYILNEASFYSSNCIQYQVLLPCSCDSPLPKFLNLKNLELKGYYSAYEYKLIPQPVESCSKLQNLCIEKAGIVPGDGDAFVHQSALVLAIKEKIKNADERLGADIIQKCYRMVKWAGIGRNSIESKWEFGCNAITDKYENLVEW
ncbi:RUBISCO SUBUNIT BINDING-protein ALPHA SUBUNIT [Artemisia annua]|uniref:RUBISCO SUBUNIT BINDING-protein ALPHA SUBUNIT n=1 Tax=Artemisia annua TaxID=35608 RepID=A0A2U1PTC1_ARTAN|nr:RUBISCO SUBUNIT BINDING-protein ALPHA SUBUNIT [Artemisia annua]